MLVTVTGDFGHADLTPAGGRVLFAPWLDAVHAAPDPVIVTRARVETELDPTGAFTVDLIGSYDPGWLTTEPVPYLVRWGVSGSYVERVVLIPDGGPWDLSQLVDLTEPPTITPTPTPGPIGPEGPTGPVGPQGPIGATGPTGLQGEVAVGTTVTTAPGTSASVSDVDASPNRAVLNFTIPRGDVGATGPAIGALLTTKGDMVARDATTTVRLPVGTAGQELVVDAAAAAGVKWQTTYQVTHPNTDDVLVQVWDAGKARWQVAHYDSGQRNIAGLLVNGWTAPASITLRRINNTVYLDFANSGPVGSAATLDTLLTLPLGFRAHLYKYWPNIAAAGTTVIEMEVTQPGALRARVTVPVASIGRSGSSWATNDAIPASLPGTLVTAAPAFAFPGSIT